MAFPSYIRQLSLGIGALNSGGGIYSWTRICFSWIHALSFMQQPTVPHFLLFISYFLLFPLFIFYISSFIFHLFPERVPIISPPNIRHPKPKSKEIRNYFWKYGNRRDVLRTSVLPERSFQMADDLKCVDKGRRGRAQHVPTDHAPIEPALSLTGGAIYL